MARWLGAYALGCAFAAPILFIGGLASFQDHLGSSGTGFRELVVASFLLLIILFLVVSIVCLLPSLLMHFVMKGAQLRDVGSYVFGGAVTWALTNFVALLMTSQGGDFQKILLFVFFSAIAGAIAMGVFRSRYDTFDTPVHDLTGPTGNNPNNNIQYW